MHEDFADNYHHRHQSHIYPVFPGTEVTRENNPELFKGFVTAVKKRLVIGLKQQSGWSLAHMACNYARMGEGDLALDCLDVMSRSCVLSNFYTLHNDFRGTGIGLDMEWAPFQIDANMGWSAAVQEMLMFSLPSSISLLPALPKRWRKGIIGPLLTRGQVLVRIDWDQDEGIVHAELLSAKRNQTVQIICPVGWMLNAVEDKVPRNKNEVQLQQGVTLKIQLNFKDKPTYQRNH
jgi:alpha-L-fucosidase 2